MTSKSRLPLVVLGAVVAAAGLTLYAVRQRSTQAPSAEPVAQASVPAGDDRTMVSLRSGQLTPGDARASTNAPTLTPEQLAEKRAEADRRIHAQLAQLDGAFRQQPQSGGMAALQGRAQALLSDPALEQSIARPTTAAFECRQQQCRLSAEFAPGAPPDDWMMRLTAAGAPLFGGGQVGKTREPDGRTVVVAYFTGAQSGNPPRGVRPPRSQ